MYFELGSMKLDGKSGKYFKFIYYYIINLLNIINVILKIKFKNNGRII